MHVLASRSANYLVAPIRTPVRPDLLNVLDPDISMSQYCTLRFRVIHLKEPTSSKGPLHTFKLVKKPDSQCEYMSAFYKWATGSLMAGFASDVTFHRAFSKSATCRGHARWCHVQELVPILVHDKVSRHGSTNVGEQKIKHIRVML